MAVAPINKVREVLDYAVSVIPTDKIFMGIPNYGYDWPLPFVQGETRARTVGNVEAQQMAVRYNATIQWDPIAMAPFFYYTSELGIEHVVWFEDAESIRAKNNLIIEYKLHGAGYWNIMRFFPASWEVTEEMFQIRKV